MFKWLWIYCKKQIHICNLKDFPTKIEHCIEFSKNIFTELFFQYINGIKLTTENLNQFDNIINQINEASILSLNIEIYKKIFYIVNNPSKIINNKICYFYL